MNGNYKNRIYKYQVTVVGNWNDFKTMVNSDHLLCKWYKYYNI